ncbi:IS200/IS605 family transposase [Algivirga pacifica]|uniref:IS200/IS605 family transposase n=1 Tax=Algivirga pacifica TaxID=1162670 RepID=A0ABP9D789_9BACT
MPQSLVKNYIHLVFSTKHREPLILPEFEVEIHDYLGGLCNQFDSPVLKVGGYVDHIHILCNLSKNLKMIDLARLVKGNSSKWIKSLGPEFEHFYWQEGYGAFSVTPYDADKVVRYIENQKNHHEGMTFQDEFRRILRKYEVEYDERYVWD